MESPQQARDDSLATALSPDKQRGYESSMNLGVAGLLFRLRESTPWEGLAAGRGSLVRRSSEHSYYQAVSNRADSIRGFVNLPEPLSVEKTKPSFK